MRRSFVLVLGNHKGSFLKAYRVFAREGLDVVRASYNKVIDVHTFFVEVEGTPEQMAASATLIGALADSGRATIGARVPSKSMATRTRAGSAAALSKKAAASSVRSSKSLMGSNLASLRAPAAADAMSTTHCSRPESADFGPFSAMRSVSCSSTRPALRLTRFAGKHRQALTGR